MNKAFIRGFVKRANDFGVDSDNAMSALKSMFGISDTSDNLFDVADKGRSSTPNEIAHIGGHIGSHGLLPGLIGGGIGAASGAVASKDKKKGALKGGLVGGGAGFLAGAGNDAYNLGANTRTELAKGEHGILQDILAAKSENQSRLPLFRQPENLYNQEEHRVRGNIDEINNSKWYEYYYPPKVLDKLR